WPWSPGFAIKTLTVAGPPGPVRSVGGLRRGAIRLRPAGPFPFQTRSARPASSVGGLRRGAIRLRPAGPFPFQTRSARPASSVGGLRRGAIRLRPAGPFPFQTRSARPASSVGGLRQGAIRLRPPCRSSLHSARELEDAAPHASVFDGESSHRHRQLEPAGAGASRIEKQHAVALLPTRPVAVSW